MSKVRGKDGIKEIIVYYFDVRGFRDAVCVSCDSSKSFEQNRRNARNIVRAMPNVRKITTLAYLFV